MPDNARALVGCSLSFSGLTADGEVEDYALAIPNVLPRPMPDHYLHEGGTGISRTVFEDGDRDILTGSEARDLYFANLAGGTGGLLDTLIARAADEDAYDLY